MNMAIVKRFFFLLIRLSLVHVLIRETFQRNRVTILLYHSVDPSTLDFHLSILQKVYNIIPLEQYVLARETGKTKLPKKALVLTLDDGHASNRALLPVFRKYNIRPTIFLCTGIVGTRRHFWFKHQPARAEISKLKELSSEARLARLRQLGFAEDLQFAERQALTWDEVEEMREQVDFQPHSIFHPCLPTCTRERAIDEISGSRSHLQSRGFASQFFAYPNGDYTVREKTLARESGYKCALSIDPGFNSNNTDLFALKRIGIPDSGGPSELLIRSSGLWAFFRYILKGRYQTHSPSQTPA